MTRQRIARAEKREWVDENGSHRMTQPELDAQPCGRIACDEERQSGHFACEVPAPEMLELEQAGLIYRSYDDSRWRWFLAE